jgi:hypothetical protein
MSAVDEMRAAIARRAIEQVGTPFRLFGRIEGKALDCVGLLLIAVGPDLAPEVSQIRYTLRGDQMQKARSGFDGSCFFEIEPDGASMAGDLVLVQPGPSQLHFLVRVEHGWVHADAGLGRVVLRPGVLPWPVRGIWRLGRI